MVTRRGRVESRPSAQARPADECPYPRPFPPGFRDCAAYRPSWFIPLTSGFDAMPAVWSCANLTAGATPQGAGRFYARCRIGDAATRAAWVETMQARRLAGLRRLSAALAAATGAITAELTAAKGAQLRTRTGTPERDVADERLRAVADRWLRALDGFLAVHGPALGDLDFPPDATRTLIADLLDRWIAQSHTAPPAIPEESLRLFPTDARVLLRPDQSDPPLPGEDQ